MSVWDKKPKEPVKPEVGMGAYWAIGTDRYACTIVRVSATGLTVTVQDDQAKRTDKNGLSEAQEYTFKRNLKGATRVFRKSSKDGLYRGPNGVTVLHVGERHHYRDPSF